MKHLRQVKDSMIIASPVLICYFCKRYAYNRDFNVIHFFTMVETQCFSYQIYENYVIGWENYLTMRWEYLNWEQKKMYVIIQLQSLNFLVTYVKLYYLFSQWAVFKWTIFCEYNIQGYT